LRVRRFLGISGFGIGGEEVNYCTNFKLGRLTILTALTLLVCVGSAFATPIGLLRVDSGSGGVQVGLVNIDFYDPLGPPDGQFLVGSGTTLTTAVGNPTQGDPGRLLDFGVATALPLVNFLTITALPNFGFDLSIVGPGSLNTNCAGLLNGQSCSPFIGSPFILTATSVGTSVSLSLGGTAHDGTGPNSTWTGSLSQSILQLSSLPPGTLVTPAAIQAYFGCTAASVGPGGCSNQGAVISSTHAGEFLAVVGDQVPEPSTAALALLGSLMLAGGLYRRRKV